MRSPTAQVAIVACAVALAAAPDGRSQPQRRHNRLIDLLSRGQVVFGWFATARTPEAARRAAGDTAMDFVFVNMEQVKSYSPPEVRTFLQTMLQSGVSRNPNDRPVMTRLPIFHDDPAAARQRTAEMLNLGVHAIVFPGMETAEEARDAIAAMRLRQQGGSKDAPAGVRSDDVGEAPASWGMSASEYRKKADVHPINPDGELAAVFIVESVKGIENSRAITRERPTVAIPGPGTLGRVFKGDREQVERAIQTQLAACKEFNVACGITAGPADVERRIAEGFRLIIIYDRDYAETLRIGRQAARRVD
jgi:4-hydroxy-2-oxoheptanedioate aldolase